MGVGGMDKFIAPGDQSLTLGTLADATAGISSLLLVVLKDLLRLSSCLLILPVLRGKGNTKCRDGSD